MTTDGLRINLSLERQLSNELTDLVRGKPIGSQLSVPPSAGICSSLELFLPQLLRSEYPEWARESLDGIFVARAKVTGTDAVQLIGTCILISDQTVTPFLVDLEVSPAAPTLGAFRVLLGEPGGGPLGISGPECNSKEASRLLECLISRLDDVAWSYKVTSRD